MQHAPSAGVTKPPCPRYYGRAMCSGKVRTPLLIPLMLALLLPLVLVLVSGCAGLPETQQQLVAAEAEEEAPQEEAPEEADPPGDPREDEPAPEAASPDDAGSAEEARGVAEPVQDPLETVLQLLPEEQAALSTQPGAEPIVAEIDLTGDGRAELVVFTVAGGDGSRALSELSDISRTVDAERMSARFGVSIFQVSGREALLLEEVSAGRSPVLRNAGVRRLREEGDLPVAFFFDFVDARGQETVWIVHGGGEKVSTLSIRKDAIFGASLEDIDDDGVTDVLRSERILEDGTGYETFITWLRWDGEKYGSYRTTNVVRNLNAYLRKAAGRISDGDFGAFAELALSPEVLAELRQAGVSPLDIANRILQPASSALQSFRSLIGRDGRLEAAEFPRYFENPFPKAGARVTTPVRIVCCGGLSAVFETQLVMAENPFETPQFHFIPAKE